jgi:hypothetical protein
LASESEAPRAELYLQRAAETRLLAQRSDDPAISAAYLELAAAWIRLAEEAKPSVWAGDVLSGLDVDAPQ